MPTKTRAQCFFDWPIACDYIKKLLFDSEVGAVYVKREPAEQRQLGQGLSLWVVTYAYTENGDEGDG